MVLKEEDREEQLRIELEMNERIPHSVVSYMVSGLEQENTPEMQRLKTLANNSAYPMQGDLRTVKNNIYSIIGVLEYHAVSRSVPERTAVTLMEIYMHKIEAATQIDAITAYFSEFYDNLHDACMEAKTPRPEHNRIFNCMEYIENNTHTRYTVADLAALMGYHPDYLSHHFKQQTGKTISQYRIECRIKEAARMLSHTNRSISEIAEFLCFTDQSHFQRCFKNYYGVTPDTYRKENMGKCHSHFS